MPLKKVELPMVNAATMVVRVGLKMSVMRKGVDLSDLDRDSSSAPENGSKGDSDIEN